MFQDALKKKGVTGSQAEVIRLGEEREPFSLSFRHVDRLVQEGLVI
ncbi:MAG: hypothetical protein ACE3L7_01585 [Candidatus Pristimantibacillus sp.]